MYIPSLPKSQPIFLLETAINWMMGTPNFTMEKSFGINHFITWMMRNLSWEIMGKIAGNHQTSIHCHPFKNGCLPIWVLPKIMLPQNGWFIVENPIKMDDLGVPLFLETPISIH